MGNIILCIFLAFQFHGTDINLIVLFTWGFDGKSLSIRQLNSRFLQHRSTDNVLSADRIYRIKAKCAKHIPSRHFPAIIITGIARRRIVVQFIHDMRHIFLCLPRFSRTSIQISHVMARLIAMRILPYKTGSIVIQLTTLIIDSEEGIQFCGKSVVAPCQ